MKHQPLVVTGKVKLRQFDPRYRGDLKKAAARKLTKKLGRRIGELQQLLYANSRHAALLIFQGMDASGKDGSIKSVLEYVTPAGVETANFKEPSAEERAHDYLWRVHRVVPRRGNIGVFNRSHYEAVLAERVLRLITRAEWQRRYREIVDFERMLADNGVLVLKFHLHISREEQAERFRERLANPKKNWKFSTADVTTRQHWSDYVDAYEDMLNATSHPAARWHVVPADRKWYRDLVVASTVEQALSGLRMKWPKPDADLKKVRIK